MRYYDEYGFLEDIREKKKAGTGARHKKRHTGCRLPYDSMTRKEKKAMSGPVVSFDLSQPMSFEKFKALKDGQQRTQLEVYGGCYGWTSGAVAQVLGVSQNTAYLAIKRLGLVDKFKEEHAKASKEKKAGQKRSLALATSNGSGDTLTEATHPQKTDGTAWRKPFPIEEENAPQAQNEGPMELDEPFAFDVTASADNASGAAIAKRLSGILASINKDARYKLLFVLKEIK